jgi:hypothetical protein
MPRTAHDSAAEAPGRLPVEVMVNGQAVELAERRMTGLEIKQAAIAQGVLLEETFQLSVRHGQRYQVVGDDERITVRPNLEFLAVAPDDNS